LKSQNYKNISDLSIGFASITSEFHIYLLRLFGQTEFFKISFTSSSEPPDLLGRAAEISDLLKPRNWIFENNRFFVFRGQFERAFPPSMGVVVDSSRPDSGQPAAWGVALAHRRMFLGVNREKNRVRGRVQV
jgi:hypothetical protein